MIKKFEDILDIINGKNQKKVENPNGAYPIYGSGGVMGYANDYLCKANTVVIGRKGNINNPIYVEEPFWNVDTAFGLVAKQDILLSKYLYYFCVHYDFSKLNTTVTIPSLTKANLLNVEIDVPNIEEQKNIVMKLDSVIKLMRLQEEQIDSYDKLIKSRFVEMFGDLEINPKKWEMRLLSQHLDVTGGYAFKSSDFSEDIGIPVLRIGNINGGVFKPVNMVYWPEDEKLVRYLMYPGDLVMSLTGTVGKDDYGNVCILGNDYDNYYLNQRNAKIEIRDGLDKLYLAELLKFDQIKKRLTGISRGVRQANISNKDILDLVVPVPPIELQSQFAAFVTKIDKLKVEIQRNLEKAQLLFDSLMQQYFG